VELSFTCKADEGLETLLIIFTEGSWFKRERLIVPSSLNIKTTIAPLTLAIQGPMVIIEHTHNLIMIQHMFWKEDFIKLIRRSFPKKFRK